MLAHRSRLGAWLLCCFAGATGAVWAGSCGDAEVARPCDTTLKEQCGKTCAVDTDCASGLYCGGDLKCTADCTKDGGQCKKVECSDRGRCPGEGGANATTSGGFATGQTAGPDSGAGGGCADVVVDFAPQIPSVLLLIDQSGSMTEQFGGGSRWNVLHDILMDPNDGIVKQLDSAVRFGLALYSGDGGQNCPELTTVPVALGNYATIEASYGPQNPLDETPTGESITAVLPALLAVTDPGPKAIVLATDGEPDTCAQPNPQNGQGVAVAAAQAAYAAGVSLYIIAVGNEVSAGHQQDMANAGTGKALDHSQGDAPFYPANDPQALADAFQTIINGQRSCILTLNGTIDPDKAAEGSVTLDGNPLGYGDPDGWKLDSPTQIELTGAACDAIQDGTHSVVGHFPCDAVGPPQ